MSRKRVELLEQSRFKRQTATQEFLASITSSRSSSVPSDLPATNLFIPSIRGGSAQKRNSLSHLGHAHDNQQSTRPATTDGTTPRMHAIEEHSTNTPLLPDISKANPGKLLTDDMTKEEMQLTYGQARLQQATGVWTKEGNTNSVSRTFPLGTRRSSEQNSGLADRHVERLRTNQMTGEQKVADVINSSSRKADFIRMQREIVEEKISRLKKVPGTGYSDSTPVEKPLPDLKTALKSLHLGLNRNGSELEDDFNHDPDDDEEEMEVVGTQGKAGVEGKKSTLSFFLKKATTAGTPDHEVEHQRPGKRLKSKLLFQESLKKQNMIFASSHIAGMSFSALHGYRSQAVSPSGSSRQRWKKMDRVRASVLSNTGSIPSSLGLKSTDAEPVRTFGESLKSLVSTALGSPRIDSPGGGRQRSLRSLMSSVSVVLRMRSMRNLNRSNSTVVLIPDATLIPDLETEEALESALQELRLKGGDEESQPLTYSHLFKPTSRSAKSSFVSNGHADEWPADTSLSWPCRGIGLKKMQLLQETLMVNRGLTGLRLPGNNLTNECVALILSSLSLKEAPSIQAFDLSMNSSLTWMVAYPLAEAIGGETQEIDVTSRRPASPSKTNGREPSSLDKAATPTVRDDASLTISPAHYIHQLGLSRLLLEGIKLQDKGAMILAKALSRNMALKELNISRCSIQDAGGASLFLALSQGFLVNLDISWNQLGVESAKSLCASLSENGSLQKLNLSHNGFSDLDASIILKGLALHGSWRNVDLSYNNVGSGAALMISELTDLLGQKAADLMAKGVYAQDWENDESLLGKVDYSISHGIRAPRHTELGTQLLKGPVMIDLTGNPLGATGLKQLLHSLDWMSCVIENAAVDQAEKAGMLDLDHITSSLAWPIQVLIASCNIDINDQNTTALIDDTMDARSPNPFIKSLWALREIPDLKISAKGKDGKGGSKDKGSDAKKGAPAETVSKVIVIKETSQMLDLTSPAGSYRLNAAHPATWSVIRHILALSVEVTEASSKGLLKDVQLQIKDVAINRKASKADKLASLSYEEMNQGLIEFTILCPAVLNASEPSPISDQVVEFLADSLADKTSSELWKLSVVRVATNSFSFTYEQTLALSEIFDIDMQTNERIRASELFYAKCIQPIEFWMEVLPLQPPRQISLMLESLGDLSAFDKNNPTGRYLLNLSRPLDRIIARRLQDSSALESPYRVSPFYSNWRNATLNGSPLVKDGLGKGLRSYTIPNTGSLRFDYVSFRMPDNIAQVCDDEDVHQLLRDIRAIQTVFDLGLMKIRDEYLPLQQRASVIRETKAREALKSFRPHQRAALANTEAFHAMSNQIKRASEAGVSVPLLPRRSHMVLTHVAKDLKAEARSMGESSVSQSWWQKAGFNSAGSSLLKQYNQQVKEREAKLEALRAKKVTSRAESDRIVDPAPAPAAVAEVKKPSSPSKEKEKDGKGKKGKEEKGEKKKGGKEEKVDMKKALPVPHLRTHSDFVDPWAETQAKELASILLLAHDIKDVQLLLSKFSAKHIARVLRFFFSVDAKAGVSICRAILDALPPVSAARFLYSTFDQGPIQLLPPNIRLAILSACAPEMIKHLNATYGELDNLAMTRARAIRVTLQCFAAYKAIRCDHLAKLLSVLHHEQDRCTAFVCLWSRIVDRDNIYEVYQLLRTEEQRQVMNRLGHMHVWNTIQRPENLHFYLELTDPEQKEIAKVVIKQGIKLSVAAKAGAKAAGQSSSPSHLLQLHGNGLPISASEEDSLWRMLENSYATVEFDFRPEADQLERAKERSALVVQRRWREICTSRELQRKANVHMTADPIVSVPEVAVEEPIAGENSEDFDEEPEAETL